MNPADRLYIIRKAMSKIDELDAETLKSDTVEIIVEGSNFDPSFSEIYKVSLIKKKMNNGTYSWFFNSFVNPQNP